MGQNLGPLNIQDSYQALVQISGSDQLTNGTGSLLTSLDVSASYATSASHALAADYAISAGSALTSTSSSFATRALTASFAENVIPPDTGSLLITASYSDPNLTFTKGDGTTFDVEISTTIDTGSFVTTASVSDATLTFTKADGSTFDTTINNVVNADTASYVAGTNVVGAVTLANTANFATLAATANTASYVAGADVDGAVALATNATNAVTAETASFLPSDTNLNINSISASSATFESASIGFLESITGSAKIIGDEYIILNNNTPTQRYAGIIVQDSGSTNNTASFEFDGQTNDWFYEYTDDGGATAEYGVVMFGPGYNTRGSHVYPANNTILKGTGDHHIVDSSITDDGTDVKIGANLQVTGSISATAGFEGTITNALTASLADQVKFGTTNTASFISIPLMDINDVFDDGYADFVVDANNNLLYKPSTGQLLIATGSTLQVEQSVLIGQGFPDQGLVVSGSTDINGVLSLPGIPNVSESIAGAGNLQLEGTTYFATDQSLAGFYDTGSVIVGIGASTTAPESVIIGGNASGGQQGGVAIGYNADAGSQEDGIAIGRYASATGQDAYALGTLTTASYDDCIAVGDRAAATDTGSIAFGAQSDALNPHSIALGYLAQATNELALDVRVNNSSIITATTASQNITLYGDLEMGANAVTFVSASQTGSAIDNVHPTQASSSAQLNHIVTLTQGQYDTISGSSAAYDDTLYIISDANDEVLPGNLQVTGQIYSPTAAVSIASSTASIDFNDSNFQTLDASAGNIHLDAPTNIKSGTTYTLIITSGEDITGYDAVFKFSEGTAPTLSSGTDILTMVSDGTNLYGTGLANFS